MAPPRFPRRRNDGRAQSTSPPPRPPEPGRPHRHSHLTPPSGHSFCNQRVPSDVGWTDPALVIIPSDPTPPGRRPDGRPHHSAPPPPATTFRLSDPTPPGDGRPHHSAPPTPPLPPPPQPVAASSLPNSGPTREEENIDDDLLNRAVAENKLQMSQWHEESEKVSLKTTLEEINTSSSFTPQAAACEDKDQAVNHDTIKASSPSSHNSPPIYALKPRRLYFKYYVRVDSGGSVHTYPTLTGPFQSLEDVQDAINSLHAEQCKMMCMKGLSEMEIGIRRALYWHNGLRKNSAEALTFMNNHRPVNELVRALLDKYNEDYNLSGDLVYELIKIVHCGSIHERNGSSNKLYYHLNLVIRTKGAVGRINNLFFAEVACMNGKHEEFELTFFLMLKPDDNGKCIECHVDMKHPSDVEYHRGRAKIPMPGMGPDPDEGVRAYMEELITAVYDEAELKAQEARVRNEFKELYGRGLARDQEKYVVPASAKELYGRGIARVQEKYVVPARRQGKGVTLVRGTA